MGARKEKKIDVPQAQLLVVVAVDQALQMIGATLVSQAPEQGRFSARTGMTIRSLGEQIDVVVEGRSPTHSTVHVSSEAGQLIDWGKNAQNLKQFEQALAQSLAEVASAPIPAQGPRAPVKHQPAAEPIAEAIATPSPKSTAAPNVSWRVFVSYRRDDSGMIVGRICDRLTRDVGAENIFKDIDNIPFGVDFVELLDREVQKCTVLFAVIGPRWLEATDQGARRLDDPNDFVRIEIGTALRRNIPVVPLLVDGAHMPRAEELPDDLKPLTRRNGTEIRNDPDFHNDMSRLLSRLA